MYIYIYIHIYICIYTYLHIRIYLGGGLCLLRIGHSWRFYLTNRKNESRLQLRTRRYIDQISKVHLYAYIHIYYMSLNVL